MVQIAFWICVAVSLFYFFYAFRQLKMVLPIVWGLVRYDSSYLLNLSMEERRELRKTGKSMLFLVLIGFVLKIALTILFTKMMQTF